MFFRNISYNRHKPTFYSTRLLLAGTSRRFWKISSDHIGQKADVSIAIANCSNADWRKPIFVLSVTFHTPNPQHATDWHKPMFFFYLWRGNDMILTLVKIFLLITFTGSILVAYEGIGK